MGMLNYCNCCGQPQLKKLSNKVLDAESGKFWLLLSFLSAKGIITSVKIYINTIIRLMKL